MKKLLKISLLSMLVAMPMIAGAAPVAGEPVAGNADSPTATNTPKYALKGAGDGDGNTATAGYVKGAYNAVIKGINNTQDEINTLNTGITTYRNAIGHLTDGKATQDGTVATIKKATTTESINDSTVNFTGVTTTSISATASGNVNLSIPVMADWENDAEAENPLQTTTSFSGLAVNNLTMSAPTSNTATLTKTGIGGDVDVANYLAQAATPTYWYTPLLNAYTSDYTAKSSIYPAGSNKGNVAGLSDGEWTVTWNAYGTVKGTSMCSGDGSGMSMGQTTTGSLSISGETKYCWCKMTGWTPKNETETPVSALWVFGYTDSSASGCASQCAGSCGYYASSYSSMGSVQ